MQPLHTRLTALFAVIATLPGRNWGRTDDRIMFEDSVHLVPAEMGSGIREYEALVRAPNGEEGRGAHGDGDKRTFDRIAAVLYHAAELKDLLEHPTLLVLLRVLAERERQQEAEGFGTDHDDAYHDDATLGYAASSYLGPVWKGGHLLRDCDMSKPPSQWPWDPAWWKPKSKVRDAERGAALAIAHLERLGRDEEREAFKKLPKDEVLRMTQEILTAAGYTGGPTTKPFKEAMKAAQRGLLRMGKGQ